MINNMYLGVGFVLHEERGTNLLSHRLFLAKKATRVKMLLYLTMPNMEYDSYKDNDTNRKVQMTNLDSTLGVL